MATKPETPLRTYFTMGAQLANQSGVLDQVKKRVPEADQRTVLVKILTPHPEVSHYIPDWLRLYAQGKMKPGSVSEEIFTIFMDPKANKIGITDSWRVPEHTVTFLIEENTCWSIAARKETVFTAYHKGYPLRVIGDFKLRDMELVDEILRIIFEALKAEGKDLSELFRGIADGSP